MLIKSFPAVVWQWLRWVFGGVKIKYGGSGFALTTELGGCKGGFSPLIDNGGDLVERPLMAVLQMDLE